jgi:predicted transcriptional regulator
MGARWTAKDLEFLVQGTNEGLSKDELAAALERTVSSIEEKLRVARANGSIPKSARFWGPERTALLLQLRAEGLTAEQIAPRVGFSPGNVRRKVHRCIQQGLVECKYDDWMSADRVGVPVEALADYRFYRSKNFSAAEAAAMCREARP